MSEHVREPIQVNVGMNYKINMGNYESLGIHISITDTQQPGETAIQAHERVFNFVNRRLQDKVGTVREELEGQADAGGY